MEQESISFSLPPLPPRNHSEASRGPASPRSLTPRCAVKNSLTYSPSSVSYEAAPHAPPTDYSGIHTIHSISPDTKSISFRAIGPEDCVANFLALKSPPVVLILHSNTHCLRASVPSIRLVSPQLTQYTYRSSTRRPTRYHSLGASEEEGARFPTGTALAIPNAILTTTPPFYYTCDTTAILVLSRLPRSLCLATPRQIPKLQSQPKIAAPIQLSHNHAVLDLTLTAPARALALPFPASSPTPIPQNNSTKSDLSASLQSRPISRSPTFNPARDPGVGISAGPGAKVGMGMPPTGDLGALARADISAPPPMGDAVDSAPNACINVTHTHISPPATPISPAAYLNPMLRL
ncbi:hypothetical protein C8R44DRAFT_974105 [Mycena epipterygia]|nr:hypothetical protein C8R44DRAFT_974105 [Mycena epipterygia]